MSMIDPAARVEDGAVIGEGTTIGPYCIIGPNVVIGAHCKLIAHVHITAQTTIGDGCTIYPFVSLGTPPQSLNYRGELTRLQIGARCTLRESVTMNAGTAGGGGITRVGERGYFMNGSHVGHDCQVGNDVIFATSATLGGHCEIGDFAFIGGLSAVHQFTRVGPQVMVGGVCGVRGDVIPFGLVNGQYATLEGLNIVGMRRRKFTKARLLTVRAFYKKLFHGPGIFAERLIKVQPLASQDPAIAEILEFIRDAKHRALCLPAGDSKPASTSGP
ncbi:acyl-ACP--UDP-N-acetylglucosamine O-acyltransferase [Bradyrhizobium sp.]|jgi:UDP-N-acetylglucosamine acyltransferase|uniref:acyl-ACP--UDP-N-acetylglucosamine O-acyltransferase n=1 Tax=Bradyrhizobium sp. TaxID=376 RepID=UPI003BAE8E36